MPLPRTTLRFAESYRIYPAHIGRYVWDPSAHAGGASAWRQPRQPRIGNDQIQGVRGWYRPLLDTPWANEPNSPADVHTPLPKRGICPYKVGWNPGKPRGMNKGYVLPPLKGDDVSVAPGPRVVPQLELVEMEVAYVP